MIRVGLREYMERTGIRNEGNTSGEFCYNESREIKWELKMDFRSALGRGSLFLSGWDILQRVSMLM